MWRSRDVRSDLRKPCGGFGLGQPGICIGVECSGYEFCITGVRREHMRRRRTHGRCDRAHRRHLRQNGGRRCHSRRPLANPASTISSVMLANAIAWSIAAASMHGGCRSRASSPSGRPRIDAAENPQCGAPMRDEAAPGQALGRTPSPRSARVRMSPRPTPPNIDSVDTQRLSAFEAAPTRTRRRDRTRSGDRRRHSTQAAAPWRRPSALDAQHPVPPDLDDLASQWQRALDAGELALRAAVGTLPASYLNRRRRELIQERQDTAALLTGLARSRGVRPLPWLSPVPLSKEMLGLTAPILACLFDLDGVLTDSARLHAHAWAQVLDELLLRSTAATGWHFIPFDRDADYRTYIDGHSRLEGIHSFLDSRGIRLPEGRVDDPTECRHRPRAGQAQG